MIKRVVPVDQLDHRQIKSESPNGGALLIATQIIGVIASVGVLFFLARFLAPADFGLVAMAAPIVGLAQMFANFGFARYTIQQLRSDPEIVDTNFWCGLVVALATYGIVIAAAPAIAGLYGAPEVEEIAVVLGFSIVISSLYAQHHALVARNMRFDIVMLISVTAVTVSAVAAVCSAFAGIGYWALAVQTVGQAAISCVLYWVMCAWHPRLAFSWVKLRAGLRFGGNAIGFDLTNYVGRNADNFLIGIRLGANDVGLYSLAYKLMTLPNQIITSPLGKLAVVGLSQQRDSADRYRDYYVSILKVNCFLGFPVACFVGILAQELVLLVLGAQWTETSEILRWLSIVAVLHGVYVTYGWLFISYQQAGRMFLWSIFANTLTVLAFVIGLYWGVQGVAIAYAAISALLFLPGTWYVLRDNPVRYRDIANALLGPLLVTILLAVALLGFKAVFPDLASWQILGLSALIYVACMIAGTITTFGLQFAKNLARRPLYTLTHYAR